MKNNKFFWAMHRPEAAGTPPVAAAHNVKTAVSKRSRLFVCWAGW
jgi:hypothetical protein